MTMQTATALYTIMVELFLQYDPVTSPKENPESIYQLEAKRMLLFPELFEDETRLAEGIYAVFASVAGTQNIRPLYDPVYAVLSSEIFKAKSYLEAVA